MLVDFTIELIRKIEMMSTPTKPGCNMYTLSTLVSALTSWKQCQLQSYVSLWFN